MADTEAPNTPFFRRPLVIIRRPGGVVFRITLRDGSTRDVDGPPGVTAITTNVEAFQPAGSDEPKVLFVGH